MPFVPVPDLIIRKTSRSKSIIHHAANFSPLDTPHFFLLLHLLFFQSLFLSSTFAHYRHFFRFTVKPNDFSLFSGIALPAIKKTIAPDVIIGQRTCRIRNTGKHFFCNFSYHFSSTPSTARMDYLPAFSLPGFLLTLPPEPDAVSIPDISH